MNKKIGALWFKTAKDGSRFMSGELEIDNRKIQIVVFKNTKQTEKQPDYRILESAPRPEADPNEIDLNDIPF